MPVKLFFDEPRSYTIPPTDQILTFRYVNWHGHAHDYVIQVESLEWALVDNSDYANIRWQWIIHGSTITRDGDTRPEMGPTRRRSFLLDKIVPAS